MRNLMMKPILRNGIILCIVYLIATSISLSAEPVKFKIVHTNNLLSIKILDIKYVNSYMMHGRFKEKPSNPSAKFVTILFEIENISGEKLQNFAPIIAAKAIDNSGITYEALTSGELNRLPTMNSLFNKQKIKGTINFEIPANTKLSGLIWDGYPYSNTEKASVQIEFIK